MGEKKKKTDGENNKNKNNDAGKKDETPTAVVVLKIDMHCDGCASKIVKCLRGFEGVESLKAESEDGKLTITGQVDPSKLRDKLWEKMKKKVDIISPQPKKENNGTKSQKKPDDKKPKEPPVTTAVLKAVLHCQGCIERIRKTVLKTKGVREMDIDKERETITVKGTMDVKALVGNLTERLKRKVEVVPPKKEKDSEKEDAADKGGNAGDKGGSGGGKKKKGGGGGGGGGGGEGDNHKDEERSGDGSVKLEQSKVELSAPAYGYGYGYGYGAGGYNNYGPVYVGGQLHAPQIFSDENPNACSIM